MFSFAFSICHIIIHNKTIQLSYSIDHIALYKINAAII